MAEETTTEQPATKRRLSKSEAKCGVEGCKRPYRAKGYCVTHYKRWRRGELEAHPSRYKTCSKEGCLKRVALHGVCAEHAGAAKGGADAAAAPAA